MYLITPSLYSSFYYYAKTEHPTPQAEDKALQSFKNTLDKVKVPPSEAMQKGIDFETNVWALSRGAVPASLTGKELEDAKSIASIVKGGIWQQTVSKPLNDFLLYGRADVIKQNHIYDLKRCQKYELGKYEPSIQHLLYMECTGIKNFDYLIYDGEEFYRETYALQKDNKELLLSRISQMVDFILADKGFKASFEKNWKARPFSNSPF